jgi:hypothetical protein
MLRNKLNRDWDIAIGPLGPVNEQGEYIPIPRRSRTIPFGYEVSTEDPDILLPIVDELVALEMAAEFLRNKQYSYRQVTNWLITMTGRHIVHSGLIKRLRVERKRKRKAEALTKDELDLKRIIQAQEKINQSLGTKEVKAEAHNS